MRSGTWPQSDVFCNVGSGLSERLAVDPRSRGRRERIPERDARTLRVRVDLALRQHFDRDLHRPGRDYLGVLVFARQRGI